MTVWCPCAGGILRVFFTPIEDEVLKTSASKKHFIIVVEFRKQAFYVVTCLKYECKNKTVLLYCIKCVRKYECTLFAFYKNQYFFAVLNVWVTFSSTLSLLLQIYI